jgi:hypothetical protein
LGRPEGVPDELPHAKATGESEHERPIGEHLRVSPDREGISVGGGAVSADVDVSVADEGDNRGHAATLLSAKR